MAFKRAIAVSLWILAIQSFTDPIASECQGGRMVGPVPTVTNERYMLIDIITIPTVLESSRLFRPNNSTEDLPNVCFHTIPSDLCQIRYLPYISKSKLEHSGQQNSQAN